MLAGDVCRYVWCIIDWNVRKGAEGAVEGTGALCAVLLLPREELI